MIGTNRHLRKTCGPEDRSLVARAIYGKCEVNSRRREVEAIEVYVTWKEIQTRRRKERKDAVPIISAKRQLYNPSRSP